jgi:hypothetical protein
MRAANDQVEGLSKPCITLLGGPRYGNDVIIETYGVVGNIMAAADQGSYVFQNIGSGVALNVRYHFTRPNVAVENLGKRYIPHIHMGEKVSLPETLSAYHDRHEVSVEYESIGKREYRTTVTLDHRVIAAFQFEEMPLPRNPSAFGTVTT